MTTESVREFWDSQPCDSIFGDKYSEIESRRYFINPHVPKWAEFDQWNGKRILEIGCGIGIDAISFAKEGAKVTATDISSVSIEQAKAHAEESGVGSNIDFLVADAQWLNEFLDPQEFDLIYACGTLHHMPDPSSVVHQIRTYFSGPKTTFKLLVYYRYSWVPLALLIRRGKGAFWRWSEIINRYPEQQDGCPITKIYSKRQARELLQGYRVEDAKVRWIYPYRDFYGRNKTWYFRWIPNRALRFLEPLLGWHLCLTSIRDDA